MSRPPAARVFSVLYLARWVPKFSRIQITISAISAEKHMHFINQLDVFIGVKYTRAGAVVGGLGVVRWIMGIVYMYLRKTASFLPI